MSTGRKWLKEIYVGFLLFLLTFLYLSHLTEDFRPSYVDVDLTATPSANVELQPS